MLPKVVLMMCYVRSGGTLLNRCLGALDNTVVLSEVHPTGGGGDPDNPRTVKSQAQEWYGIELDTDDFYGGIEQLAQHCEKINKTLIVREFSYRNYAENDPPQTPVILDTLQDRCHVIPFAFVRNPIDVALSWHQSPEKFFPGLRKFTEDLITYDIHQFKYEVFCTSPDAQMCAICDFIGVPFSEKYSHYKDFNTVNGDLNYSGGKSRGLVQQRIDLLPRKYADKATITELHSNSDMIQTCNMLGYTPNYYDPQIHRVPRWRYEFGRLKKLSIRVRRKLMGH